MATSSPDLARARRQQQSRSFRMQSVLRIGMPAIMVGAMFVGTERQEWRNQGVVIDVLAARQGQRELPSV